jgi:hypothetical protein
MSINKEKYGKHGIPKDFLNPHTLFEKPSIPTLSKSEIKMYQEMERLNRPLWKQGIDFLVLPFKRSKDFFNHHDRAVNISINILKYTIGGGAALMGGAIMLGSFTRFNVPGVIVGGVIFMFGVNLLL